MTRHDTIILGDVEITRAFEKHRLGLPRELVFPDVDEDLWRRHEGWLAPEFWDTAAGEHTLLLPAHFPSAGAVELRRDGDRYAITEWAAFG